MSLILRVAIRNQSEIQDPYDHIYVSASEGEGGGEGGKVAAIILFDTQRFSQS